MQNIYKNLKRPIVGLAPMDGITDAGFRFVIAKYGLPDIMFTEFVAVDGVCAGAEKVMEGFIYDKSEKPIVAQIFGSSPNNFYKIAPVLCELGFDGIDINMGCPDKTIIKSGSGGFLISKPELAKEIVASVKQGVTDWVDGKNIEDFGLPENIVEICQGGQMSLEIKKDRMRVPISVKTRLGTNTNIINEWARHLAEMELDNVSLHGRTLKQMYGGTADWQAIAEGAKIIKESGATVLGNGDIKTVEEGLEKSEESGVDGFLIGRAVMGNPTLFAKKEATAEERLMIAIEHAYYFEKVFKNKFFVNMRKHLVWYCRGFDGASDARARLMKVNNAKECEEVILDIIKDI